MNETTTRHSTAHANWMLAVFVMLLTAGCGLADSFDRRMVNSLEKDLQDQKWETRLRTIERFAEAAPRSKAAVAVLHRALTNSDKAVRVKAAEGLLLLATPAESGDALRLLQLEVATIKDQALREGAQRIRGTDRGAVAAIAAKFGTAEPEEKARIAGKLAAPGLDAAAAVDQLVVALHDPSRDVRLAAIFALAEWGPLATKALPALRDVVGDACASVASTAESILAYDAEDYDLEGHADLEDARRFLTSLVSDVLKSDALTKACSSVLIGIDVTIREALQNLKPFRIHGDCFDFSIQGETLSYPLYKLEVERFVLALSSDRYQRMCSSTAIKRAVDAPLEAARPIGTRTRPAVARFTPAAAGCTLTKRALPALAGLRLGMTAAQVDAVHPNGQKRIIRIGDEELYNRVTLDRAAPDGMSNALIVMKLHPSERAYHMAFTYSGQRVAAFATAHDFAAPIARQLGLPDPRSWITIGPSTILVQCDGFQAQAMHVRGDSKGQFEITDDDR